MKFCFAQQKLDESCLGIGGHIHRLHRLNLRAATQVLELLSVLYSWQVSVLLACSRSPIMQYVPLLCSQEPHDHNIDGPDLSLTLTSLHSAL